MDDLRKHVIEHYPAERLPPDLRGSIPLDATVTVTVDQEKPTSSRRKLQDFVGAGKGLYQSPEHVLKVLRDWRDQE